MTSNAPIYDLEERTYQFARSIRKSIRKLQKTIANQEDSKQLIRCSASVGANYIEANEALSKKDFLFRIKIARKEAKESAFFLRLIYESNDHVIEDFNNLHNEAVEIKKILSSIIVKSSS